MDRDKIFEQRKKDFGAQAVSLNKTYNLFSTIRIVLFLVALVLFIYFANARSGVGVAAVGISFPFIFGVLVNRHNLIGRKRELARNLEDINEDELKRINGDLKSFDSGISYLESKHSYAKDIDVFGRNSLFQLVNRASTPNGKATVAQWLTSTTSASEINQRQHAVKELTEQIAWRQEFEALGRINATSEVNVQNLLRWINEPNKLKYDKLARVFAYVLPAAILTLVALNIFAGLGVYYTIAVGFVNAIVLKKYAFQVMDITESTSKGYKALKAYGGLIGTIETSAFSSKYLVEHQSVFHSDSFSASKSILQLQRILEFLNGRSNMFYVILNVLFLFDIHLLLKAERWKREKHDNVNQWFANIGVFEAINSLAGLSYGESEFVFPTISEKPFVLKTKTLGHPLISKKERVANDFEMEGKGQIALVTGSNMSGKSTFLRTIGVNMTLAYAGAPVCATSMQLSIMHLFTSMRTEDNLEEHISSFYAELKRIKQLLDTIDSGKPVLYMLDEILKGTNSNDRHAGAEALIRQLSKKEAMGFVSTHDLALGKLSDELTNLKNYSFNSEIVDDKIIFNYKLEDGLCHSFNASKLMEQIGIEMNKS